MQTLKDGNVPIEKITGGIANWERSQASALMEQWLAEYPDTIELVISNNDDMALGAVDSLKKNLGSRRQASEDGHPWPVVIGIDGTKVGLEALQAGDLLGTVLNDAKGQAISMLELARSVVMHTELPDDIKLIDGKYIRLPYQKVTEENVNEIMWNMQIKNQS